MHRTQPPRRWRNAVLLSPAVAAAALASVGVLAQDGPVAPVRVGPDVPVTDRVGPPVPPATNPSDASALPPVGDPAAYRPPLTLNQKAESKSHGISFHVPDKFVALVEPGRDEIVRYVDRTKNPDWMLSLRKEVFPKEEHLFARPVPDPKAAPGTAPKLVPGLVENTLVALIGEEAADKVFAAAGGPAALRIPKSDPPVIGEFPGAKVLRAGDPTNIGPYNVGMIVLRYTKNGERRLVQHAIVERNDQFYYLLSLNTPGRKDTTEDANVEEQTVDPGERQAVETFRRVLDSVKLLSLDEVYEDQAQRLIRTRAFYKFLGERKLAAVAVPEQYLRVIRDGQDVGYSYAVEQIEKRAGADGLRVGIRTRMLTDVDERTKRVKPFPRQDGEAWMYAAADRRSEDWTRVTVWDNDGKPKSVENPWPKVTEVGTSMLEQKRVVAKPDPAIVAKGAVDPKNDPREFMKGESADPNQPWINIRESYSLNVQLRASRGDLDTVKRQLAPFYLPQAMAAVIHRLLPTDEPKGYMFAVYVPELQQVANRYLDVGAEQDLPKELAKYTTQSRGVPITDRLGYEGPPTTHYVTTDGKYVGSVTPKTKTVVVPVTEDALKQLWEVADVKKLFEIPQDVPGGADQMNKTRDALVNPTAPNGTGTPRPRPRPLPPVR
ncbi:MAG TPA: hypothetical protein VF796_26425 [Humisphaera sp.]